MRVHHLGASPAAGTGHGTAGGPAWHTIPDSRRGRAYRRVLLIAGILSIVGIADHVRAIFWRVLSGPPTDGSMGVPQRLIILTGWAIICWCAVRGVRSNALPPLWAAVVSPLLVWAYLLWPG